MARVVCAWGVLTAFLMVAACSSSSESREPAVPPAAERTTPTEGRTGTQVAGAAPPGAFVRLEPMFAHDVPAQPEAGFMDQSGQTFTPGAMVAQTGQTITFRSSEDVLHNVRVIRAEDKTPIFNVATPPWGAYTHTFDQPGTYDVTCDIHAAMRATILVAATPYATITDETGRFSFAEVAPGAYTLIGFSGENELQRRVVIAGARTELKLP
jgi:plastocyanin